MTKMRNRAPWWATWLLVSGALLVQPSMAQPIQVQSSSQELTKDTPFGAPYNVGGADRNSEVPLRDYLSSRIDQNRTEFIDRVELLAAQQRDIIDERDRQYAQRFAAQQEALSAALLAAEKAVANALAAAKEAVIKAETAANDRFDGVNEMRAQLDDQARNFVTKDTFEARMDAFEGKVDLVSSVSAALSNRIDGMTKKDEGASNTWTLVIAGIVFLIGVGSFLINYQRHRQSA